MSVDEEKIEDVVDQIPLAGFPVVLQHLEIGLALIVHDYDFAVDNCVHTEFLEGFGDGGKLFIEGEVVAVGKVVTAEEIQKRIQERR